MAARRLEESEARAASLAARLQEAELLLQQASAEAQRAEEKERRLEANLEGERSDTERLRAEHGGEILELAEEIERLEGALEEAEAHARELAHMLQRREREAERERQLAPWRRGGVALEGGARRVGRQAAAARRARTHDALLQLLV